MGRFLLFKHEETGFFFFRWQSNFAPSLNIKCSLDAEFVTNRLRKCADCILFPHIWNHGARTQCYPSVYSKHSPSREKERRRHSACHYRRSEKGRTRRQAQAAVWPAERKKCPDLEVFRAVICKNISCLQRWKDQKDFFFFNWSLWSVKDGLFFIYNVWNGIQWQWQFECVAVIPNHGFRFCNLVFFKSQCFISRIYMTHGSFFFFFNQKNLQFKMNFQHNAGTMLQRQLSPVFASFKTGWPFLLFCHFCQIINQNLWVASISILNATILEKGHIDWHSILGIFFFIFFF